MLVNFKPLDFVEYWSDYKSYEGQIKVSDIHKFKKSIQPLIDEYEDGNFTLNEIIKVRDNALLYCLLIGIDSIDEGIVGAMLTQV